MKVTKEFLRRVIKEELEGLGEAGDKPQQFQAFDKKSGTPLNYTGNSEEEIFKKIDDASKRLIAKGMGAISKDDIKIGPRGGAPIPWEENPGNPGSSNYSRPGNPTGPKKELTGYYGV